MKYLFFRGSVPTSLLLNRGFHKYPKLWMLFYVTLQPISSKHSNAASKIYELSFKYVPTRSICATTFFLVCKHVNTRANIVAILRLIANDAVLCSIYSC